MTTRTSLTSGNWSSDSSWSPDGVPGPGDSVVIAGHSITLDVDTASLASLEVQPNGRLTLAGQTVNASILLTFIAFGGSAPAISGWGTLNGEVTGSGTVTATGGTLTLAGNVYSGISFGITSGTLKFAGTASVSALSLSNAGQTLEVASGGNLTTNGQNVSGGAKIVLSGGNLTDISGLVVGAGGTLAGFGTVLASMLMGTGTITASGGTLTLSAPAVGSNIFAIDTTSASTLKFANTAAVESAISMTNANQTLEVGTSGSLTIGAAQTITNGRIVLSGGTLADSSGLTIGAGATLSGFGTVTGNIGGSGGISVSGGLLQLNGPSISIGILSFAGSNGTLQVAAAANLTITAAATITNGTIVLTGGTLTDSAGLTIGAGATLSGSGTVAANIATGTGTITALGTLILAGTVASGNILTISNLAVSRLKFTNVASAASAIAIFSAAQTLEVGAGGSLTIGAAENITNGKIVLSGGTLTDASGLTIGASAALSGFGTVAANIAAGSGSITASGGTLLLSGTVAGGNTFTVDTASASTLKFANTATTASAIAINNANQTLEVASGGNLTIGAAQGITNGRIVLSGGTLNDSSGMTIGAGAKLAGYGTLSAVVGGAGTIAASGGTLLLLSNVSGIATLAVGSAAGDTLLLAGAINSATSVSFTGSAGTLELSPLAGLTLTNSLAIGANTLKLDAAGSILTDTAGVTLGGGTISGGGSLSAGTGVTGYGTIGVSLSSGSGSITASGGTLTLAGTVSGRTLAISSAALKITGAVTSTAALSIVGIDQTLEVAAGGTLTIIAAQNVTNGRIVMSGGTLIDAAGLTIDGGALIGFGTVAANIADRPCTIMASGGTLTLAGSVTFVSPDDFPIQIDTVAGSRLKITGTANLGASISITNANQSLEVGIGGSLTFNASPVQNGTIVLSGGTITASSSLALDSTGTLTGFGTFAANMGTGSGTITASGGILTLSGILITHNVFTIDAATATTLKFTNRADLSSAIGITSVNQTLEVGVGGDLRIGAAQSITNGKIVLSGGSLTDASGLTIGSNGTLSGFGTVVANIGGSGAMSVGGGLLQLNGSDNSIGTLGFTGSSGTLQLAAAANLTIGAAASITNGTIVLNGGTLTDASGLTIGAGGTLSGLGTVSANIAAGSGTIASSGVGTLTLAGTVGSGNAFTIGIFSRLKFTNTATTSAAILFNNSTLEVGPGGNLTIEAAQSVTGGKIVMSGGTLNDPLGLSLAVSSTLGGFGTVAASIALAGTITASGGALTLSSTVSNLNSGTLAVGNAATGDALILNGTNNSVASVNFAGSTGTLELGPSAGLTVLNELAIGANTLKLDGAGSTVTGPGGVTLAGGTISGLGSLSASTRLTGYGTISVPLSSGSGPITASGGTLILAGAVSGRTLVIASNPGSVLKFTGTATSTAAISIFNANQKLEVGAGGSLTINAAQTVNSGTMVMSGGTLIDAAGLTIGGDPSNASSKLIGYGTVAADVTAGTGTITASGGTLALAGAVAGGNTFAIDATTASTLKLTNTSTAAAAISINNANQTLEIGTGGNLTIGTAQSITNGRIVLSGGKLTDAFGLTIGAGGTLSGFGKVTGALNGAGTVTASGGTLEFAGTVDGTSATNFHIANVAGSVLKFDDAVGSASVHPVITFDGGPGVLDLSATTLANFRGTLANFGIGQTLKVAGAAAVVLDASGTFITVYGASHNALGTLGLARSYLGSEFDVSSGLISVGLDATTPTGGTPALTAASDSGASSADDLTNVAAPSFTVSLGGSAAAGDTVELLLAGSSLAHPATHTLSFADIDAGSVTLTVTSGDLGADGTKSISAKFTDLAGNTSTTSALQVTLDTTPPASPVLTLGTGVGVGGATAAEATQGSGVVTVQAEAGTALTVTFTNGASVVHKTLTADGSAQAVVLDPGDVSFLGDGTITVDVFAKDAAGNVSSPGIAFFTLDTLPVAPGSLVVMDPLVNAGKVFSVPFTVTGLEAGGSGVATFTDGTPAHTVTVNIVPGTTDYTVDLTGFGRNVASSLTVYDAAGNSATRAGVPPVVIVDTDSDLVLTISDYDSIPGTEWQGKYSTVTVKDLPANFAALTGSAVADMAAAGVTAIASASGTLALTVDQYAKLGTMAVGPPAKIVDTAAHIEAMTAGQFAGMSGKHIKIVQSTDRPLVIGLDQYNGLGGVLLPTDHSTAIADDGGAISALSSTFIGGLYAAGVNKLIGSTAVTFDMAKTLALGTKVTVTAPSLTLTDTAANILTLSNAQFGGLAASGFTALDATDTNLTLTVAQFTALGTVALTAGDTVTLRDSWTNVQTLSLGTLAARNVDLINITNGSFSISMSQYTDLGGVGITGTAAGTLTGTGTAIAALDFSALAGKRITTVDATDNVLSISVGQYQTLGGSGIQLTAADTVTLADTGDHIAALSAATIGTLASGRIDLINVTDNGLTFGLDQFNALGTVVLGTNTVLTLNGDVAGTANDTFTFSRQPFSAADKINGGGGSDTLSLSGNYGTLAFAADTLSNVEKLQLKGGGGLAYNITEDDGNVGAGQSLTVTAASFTATDTAVFDGSAESNGTFSFTGGAAGSSTFVGGNGADTFTGGSGGTTSMTGKGGADTINASAGTDTIRYIAYADSNSSAYDLVNSFNGAVDAFSWTTALHWDGTVVGTGGGALRSASFASDLTAAFSGVQGNEAAVFKASSGNMSSQMFLLLNDGTAGFQSGSDVIVRLANGTDASTFSNDTFKVG